MHPYTDEAVITTVDDNLTVLSPEGTNAEYSDSKYVITDALDISPGMYTAMLSGAEMWTQRLLGKGVEQSAALYTRDLKAAFESDAVAVISGGPRKHGWGAYGVYGRGAGVGALWWLYIRPGEDQGTRDSNGGVGGPDADGNSRPLSYDDLGKLELTEMAFKEALRLIPPVPSMPRRALKAFEFGGYTIPAGTPVGINIHHTHHDEELWPDPYTFDPMRFTPEKVKARHKYAWVPFGGGAHMCLGLHFAYMQVKILLAQLMQQYSIEVAPGYEPEWQAWPIPQPKDGLEVNFKRL